MKKFSVADAADQYVKHDMIQAHTAIPSYSELRLQLLSAVLNQSTHTKTKSDLFSLVTALVQLGMDTHDLIDTKTEYLSEPQMRSRQLKVLAGDYFSARFYHLLAKAGEIQLIGKLSKAVADVNRYKISLYEKTVKTNVLAEEYIQTQIHIKSELFKTFTDYIDKELQSVWETLLHHITMFEVIFEELERKEDSSGYAKSYGYWFIQEQQLRNDYLSKENNQHDISLEQAKIKDILTDRLATTFYEIKSCLNEQLTVHLKLDDLLERLTIQLSKYVVKRVETH